MGDNDKQKPDEERRQGPDDRRNNESDRRGSDRVVDDPAPRRQKPDRRDG